MKKITKLYLNKYYLFINRWIYLKKVEGKSENEKNF